MRRSGTGWGGLCNLVCCGQRNPRFGQWRLEWRPKGMRKNSPRGHGEDCINQHHKQGYRDPRASSCPTIPHDSLFAEIVAGSPTGLSILICRDSKSTRSSAIDAIDIYGYPITFDVISRIFHFSMRRTIFQVEQVGLTLHCELLLTQFLKTQRIWKGVIGVSKPCLEQPRDDYQSAASRCTANFS